MGMFSWCCKGCGHELHEGELVRLNACVGIYDGYGRAGGFDYGGSYSIPSAWHARCYNVATDKEKLDGIPSKHASNQGFGAACLENLQEYDYDPQDELSFKAVVRVEYYEESIIQEWHVVDGELKDQKEYERLYAKVNGNDNGERSVAKHIWDKAEEVCGVGLPFQYEKLVYEARDFIEKHIGMKSPERCSQSFDNFEELKLLVARQLSKLPNPDCGYEIYITASSETISSGLYYSYCKLPNTKAVPIEGEFWPHGGQKHDYVFDGTFDSRVAYMHGKTAEELGEAY